MQPPSALISCWLSHGDPRLSFWCQDSVHDICRNNTNTPEGLGWWLRERDIVIEPVGNACHPQSGLTACPLERTEPHRGHLGVCLDAIK